MNVSGMAVTPPSSNSRQSGSFAESLRKESTVPELGFASSKSFQAGDLATSLGFVSPDFIPALGEGMLDATALAEGATDEMRRYEEEMNQR